MKMKFCNSQITGMSQSQVTVLPGRKWNSTVLICFVLYPTPTPRVCSCAHCMPRQQQCTLYSQLHGSPKFRMSR